VRERLTLMAFRRRLLTQSKSASRSRPSCMTLGASGRALPALGLVQSSFSDTLGMHRDWGAAQLTGLYHAQQGCEFAQLFRRTRHPKAIRVLSDWSSVLFLAGVKSSATAVSLCGFWTQPPLSWSSSWALKAVLMLSSHILVSQVLTERII